MKNFDWTNSDTRNISMLLHHQRRYRSALLPLLLLPPRKVRPNKQLLPRLQPLHGCLLLLLHQLLQLQQLRPHLTTSSAVLQRLNRLLLQHPLPRCLCLREPRTPSISAWTRLHPPLLPMLLLVLLSMHLTTTL